MSFDILWLVFLKEDTVEDIDKLKHFMKPYYQDVGDLTLLNDYLTDYTYPECAASALWFELGGSKGLEMEGVQKIDSGAEKTVFSEPGTMQLACEKQGRYFGERCNDLNGSGSIMIKTSSPSVGGIEETYGKTRE